MIPPLLTVAETSFVDDIPDSLPHKTWECAVFQWITDVTDCDRFPKPTVDKVFKTGRAGRSVAPQPRRTSWARVVLVLSAPDVAGSCRQLRQVSIRHGPRTVATLWTMPFRRSHKPLPFITCRRRRSTSAASQDRGPEDAPSPDRPSYPLTQAPTTRRKAPGWPRTRTSASPPGKQIVSSGAPFGEPVVPRGPIPTGQTPHPESQHRDSSPKPPDCRPMPIRPMPSGSVAGLGRSRVRRLRRSEIIPSGCCQDCCHRTSWCVRVGSLRG